MATIGSISNFQYIYRNFRKAGFYRLKGWLPVVRGVAMNPVDHPHGGGQGKTSGGRPSVTPYGVITKGKPTRKNKSAFIVRRGKS
jgi:large subunit ribosomal protein L2